ncbi:MAG TPA: hypothetical protein VGK49_05940, partial [Ilumatobacteraceae bacterium]
GGSFALRVDADGFALIARDGTVLGPQLGGDLTLVADDVDILINTNATTDFTFDFDSGPGQDEVTAEADTVSVEVSGGITLGLLGASASATALSFTISGPTVEMTATGVSLSFSAGAANRVVGVSSDHVALRITDAGYALVVAGASIIDPGGLFATLGVTIDGDATLRVNTTNVTQRLVVNGVTETMAAAAPGAPYVRIDIVDAVLALPGLSFTADRIVFERSGNAVVVDGTDVSVGLFAGDPSTAPRIVAVSHADLGVRFVAAGVTAALTGGTLLGPDGSINVEFSAGSVNAFLNTVASAVTLNVGGAPVTVAAATGGTSYARVELGDVVLSVDVDDDDEAGDADDPSLTIDLLRLEQSGSDVTAIAQGVDLLLAAAGTRIVAITGAGAGLKFSTAGAAGVVLGGTFQGPDFEGITLTGSVRVAFNTIASSVTVQAPGGPVTIDAAATDSSYLRVDVTNATLELFGNAVTASTFALERNGATIEVAGTGIGVTLSAGGRRVVAISGASAAAVFTSDGVAGALVAGALLGPDFGDAFTITGTASVQFNNTTVAHTDILGSGVDVDPAEADSQFFRVDLTSFSIEILGASLDAATLSITANVGAETTVSLAATDLTLSLGDGGATPVLGVTIDDASLLVTSTGIAFDVSGGSLSTNNTGVTFGGVDLEFGIKVDTTNPANQYVRITITDAELSFGGQTFGGDFAFEQVKVSPTRTVVKVAATNVHASMGGVVSATNGSGILLASSDGIAGTMSVSVALTLPGDFDIVASTFRISINTGTEAVSESLLVAGDTVQLDLPAGPFV